MYHVSAIFIVFPTQSMPPLVLLLPLHPSYKQYTQYCKPLTSSCLASFPLPSLFLLFYTLSENYSCPLYHFTVLLWLIPLSMPHTVVICVSLPSRARRDRGITLDGVEGGPCQFLFLAFIYIHTAWSKIIPYALCSHKATDCNNVIKWAKYLLILHV